MYGEAKIVFLTSDISNCVSEHKLLRVVSVKIEFNVIQAQFLSLFLKGNVNTIDFNKVFIIVNHLQLTVHIQIVCGNLACKVFTTTSILVLHCKVFNLSFQQ